MKSESIVDLNDKERITDTKPWFFLHKENGWLDRFTRRSVLRLASQIQLGALVLQDDDETFYFGQDTATATLVARINIHDTRCYRTVFLGGSTGAGEAYIEGWWSCDDLAKLVRIFIMNTDVFFGIDKGWARFMEPFNKVFHWLHRNTITGSRKNISAHYDLGNDFYALFLDETMAYSSAYFNDDNASLKAASIEKIDRLCRQLKLSSDDHLLEIGTGWGALAIHAAQTYGCRVTTATISAEQYYFTLEKVQALGLDDKITILFEDYRKIRGTFDKIVSVEMLEAVGHAYYPTFFSHCSKLLKPSGLMALQTITIKDQQYEASKNYVDYVKRYIFPGGCLPSVTALCHVMNRHTDFALVRLEEFGHHYARTLRIWRERFLGNLDKVKALGYDDKFTRLWEYYLAYCEAAFTERHIGVVQLLFARPEYRHDM